MPADVVLLGAGASVEAGLLTADRLTQSALAAAEVNRGPAWRPQRSRTALLLNYVVSALQFSDVRRGGEAQTLPGIERLVSAVKMLAERDDLEASPFVQEWDSQVDLFEQVQPKLGLHERDQLTRKLEAVSNPSRSRPRAASKDFVEAVWKMIEQAQQGATRPRFAELHGWLIKQVAKDLRLHTGANVAYLDPLIRWSASGGTVGTLNYDLAFELSAAKAGLRCARGVDGWQETGRLSARTAGQPRLLKLHGSVDWEFDAGGGFSDAAEDSADAPALIYGQREKLQANGPFLQLLEAFRSALWDARRLLVVGYSFGDEHINTLVSRWLETDDCRQLVVVDPRLRSGWTRRNGNTDLEKLWKRHGVGRFPSFTVPGDGRFTKIPPPKPRMAILARGASAAFSRLGAAGMDALFQEAFAVEADADP